MTDPDPCVTCPRTAPAVDIDEARTLAEAVGERLGVFVHATVVEMQLARAVLVLTSALPADLAAIEARANAATPSVLIVAGEWRRATYQCAREWSNGARAASVWGEAEEPPWWFWQAYDPRGRLIARLDNECGLPTVEDAIAAADEALAKWCAAQPAFDIPTLLAALRDANARADAAEHETKIERLDREADRREWKRFASRVEAERDAARADAADWQRAHEQVAAQATAAGREIERLRAFVRSCSDNHDCDDSAYRHGTTCRAYEAEALLGGTP